MNGYFLTIVILYCVGLGISISDHGKERKPTNAWVSLISFILIMFLLHKGITY